MAQVDDDGRVGDGGLDRRPGGVGGVDLDDLRAGVPGNPGRIVRERAVVGGDAADGTDDEGDLRDARAGRDGRDRTERQDDPYEQRGEPALRPCVQRCAS
jgi:hypothetical protein